MREEVTGLSQAADVDGERPDLGAGVEGSRVTHGSSTRG